MFKLNVSAPSPNDTSQKPKRARFIMRAFQTFVLILNVSIFKGMQVGDAKGNEPSNKSFAFAQGKQFLVLSRCAYVWIDATSYISNT